MEPRLQRNNFIKIRSSNLIAEKENIFPSKYIREKYPHLNEVVPKNSILFKVKYKPDIIINQYNQTSNNINTNIKIKPNPSLRNSRNIHNQIPTYIPHKYYNEFTNNTLLNYLDENDFNNQFYNISDSSDNNFFDKKNDVLSPIRNIKSIQKKSDSSRKINSQNINNNNIKHFSLNSNKNSSISQNSEENNLKNKKNGNNNNNLYFNFIENTTDKSSKFDYDNGFIFNPSKNVIIQDLHGINNSINNTDLFSKKMINKIVKNEITKKIKDYNSDNNVNNILNEKLEIYRTKLFNEFFKHFKSFYNIRLRKYFFDFLERIKKMRNTYNIIFRNNNPKKAYNIKINDKIDNSKEIFNSNLSLKNNKPIYKKINKRTINNTRNDNNNQNNNISYAPKNIGPSILSKNKSIVKSAPKIKVNKNNNTVNYTNLSIKRRENKDNAQTNSLSPSFKFGNEKIIIRDINFKTEGNANENELYRDTKELDKKYKQIQSRRVWSKLKKKDKNKNLSIKLKSEKNITKSDIDSEFEKIRNYMKLIKRKENNSRESSNTNTFNSMTTKNINNKNIIRIKKVDYENNSNTFNEYKNKNLYNYIMQKHNNRVLKMDDKNSYNFNQSENNSNNNNNSLINNYTNKYNSINYLKKKEIKLLQLNNTNKENNNTDANKNNNKNNPINIFSPPKNNIYFSYNSNNTKKNISKYKIFSARIKNISTKDKRINICINYYFLIRKNKPKYERYNLLFPSNNFSLNYIKNNLKSKLSSIKEEDFQQTPNFYDKNEFINKNITEKIRQYYKIDKIDKMANTNEEIGIGKKNRKKEVKFIK